MAKRHKHYNNARGNGRSRGRLQRGGRRRGAGDGRPMGSSAEDVWLNSSLGAMSDDDIPSMGERSDIVLHNRGRRSYMSPRAVERYYFGDGGRLKEKSLRMGGSRPGARSGGPDRDSDSNKKMVFVKSKELYDPSHDLIEKLIAKNNATVAKSHNQSLPSPQNSDKETAEESTEDRTKSNSAPPREDEYENFEESSDEAAIESDTNHRSIEGLADEAKSNLGKDDDILFFVDESGDELQQKDIRSVRVEEKESGSRASAIEFNPSITIGKTELDLERTDNGDSREVIMKQPTHRAHPFSSYISNVMKNISIDENEDEDEDDSDDCLDNVEIDDSMFDNHKDIDIEPAVSPSDSESHENYSSEKENKPSEHLQDDEAPEFGFIEEDYQVNTSDISVTNLRLGYQENAYFVKNFQFFGDYESHWIDQDSFSDFLLNEIGLPETRLQSYFKYLENLLIPKEETPEPTLSDVRFSSSEEEFEEPDNEMADNNNILPDDVLEGIDDLVSYSMKYSDTRNQEFETRALPTMGKGKKKKFLVDEALQLESETIETLQDKLFKRNSDKAKRRRGKEDFISKERENSDDLFEKYPYGFHIQNMMDEFENFMRKEKDSMSFPPLDPHGNKTIMKFATHYNMKTNKSGNGKGQHVVVQKVKQTYRRQPNYNLIQQLLRQRPVFMRIDVSRITNNEEFKDQERRVIRERVGPKAKFHVKEGEVVGETAPEIGKDNVGRRMLEKLGWSVGETLGVEGNKGISEPIMAVVKKTKKGVGHQKREQSTGDESGKPRGHTHSRGNRRRRH
ncbi:Sqs1p KNAG_0F00880 [Huiozyma naganishii CBS 8797]|uniref:Protein SQS1 n=1 Tax=Huiozyma naganishii (strain ATCC MYA-139 / BCRC 22969 / CBS 8797 / KCTC 17520 / NBRC 10181 / NCYC 3082 / Yp74L-3) TaxID=1071383 RepID=J7RZT4_HUIN7|nr:hypothetical protein KNAG_0F00880 [Kazachstania naganishii CBS 8797]CCK70757.1 hypothetical protein KNAG_0F00880 [Kazachstania naganishii CBS 8797]